MSTFVAFLERLLLFFLRFLAPDSSSSLTVCVMNRSIPSCKLASLDTSYLQVVVLRLFLIFFTSPEGLWHPPRGGLPHTIGTSGLESLQKSNPNTLFHRVCRCLANFEPSL